MNEYRIALATGKTNSIVLKIRLATKTDCMLVLDPIALVHISVGDEIWFRVKISIWVKIENELELTLQLEKLLHNNQFDQPHPEQEVSLLGF